MEGDENPPQSSGRENVNWTHKRNWTRRCRGLLQYERFSALNGGGEARVFFVLSVPADEHHIDDAVYAIMSAHKKRPNGSPTGLKYNHDRIWGKTWNVADNVAGRELADRIDRELQTLARELEQGGNRGR